MLEVAHALGVEVGVMPATWAAIPGDACDQAERTALLTSSVTQAEVLLGIALLPAGRRRSGLAFAAAGLFDEDFGADACLPFDAAAGE